MRCQRIVVSLQLLGLLLRSLEIKILHLNLLLVLPRLRDEVFFKQLKPFIRYMMLVLFLYVRITAVKVSFLGHVGLALVPLEVHIFLAMEFDPFVHFVHFVKPGQISCQLLCVTFDVFLLSQKIIGLRQIFFMQRTLSLSLLSKSSLLTLLNIPPDFLVIQHPLS